MASYQKFNSFVEAVAEKVHNLGSDTLMVALCAAANAPVAGNSVLANLTQISYANLSSRVLTQVSSGQSAGLYKLVLNDLSLSASGGAVATFRYVVIYNDTAAGKELIAFYDYGTDVTLQNGDIFILDFDGTNGVLDLT